MTVSTEVDHNEYTGNGATTSFPYTFRIFKKSDLVVQVSDLNGNVTELVLDTGYTVTGAGTYSGGSVVLPSPLAAGWRITIDRVLDVVQETDLRNQGKFFPEVHEDAFDYLTMLIQQCFGWFRRALMKPSLLAKYYDAKQNKISNLADPSLEQDAVNNRSMRNYVDAAIAGVVGGFGWFIQYGSGAVYRTFQDKMRDNVNALDFVPFEQRYAALNFEVDASEWLINAINSGASVVRIPAGKWMISKNIDVPPGVSLIGDGIDYWDTYRPAPERLLKSWSKGTHLVFTGDGEKNKYFFNISNERPVKIVEGISCKFTEFTNEDSVGVTPATPKAMSVAVSINRASQLRNLRIMVSKNGIEGYNNPDSYSLGDDWDIGLHVYDSCDSVIDNVQIVGYWRVKGLLLTENDGSLSMKGNPEKTHFNNVYVQSGIAIRNSPQIDLVSNTESSVTFKHKKSMRITSVKQFKIAGSESVYTYSDASFDGTNITLSGISPEIQGTISVIRFPSIGNNFSGTVFENTVATTLDHTSGKPSEYFGLPASFALEVDGFPVRNLRFDKFKAQTTFDKGNCIFGDCRDVKITSSEFENGIMIAYNLTETQGYTGNLRFFASDLQSSVNTSEFKPRDAFVDNRQIKTEFTDGSFIIKNWRPTDTKIQWSSGVDAIVLRESPDEQSNGNIYGYHIDGKRWINVSGYNKDINISSRNLSVKNHGDDSAVINIFGDSGNIAIKGNFSPIIDNSKSLGAPSFRWAQVYSANGSINTSDGREKSEPISTSELSLYMSRGYEGDAILDAWGDIRIVAFRWLDAVREKGDGARWHFGVIAQQVRDTFLAHGIDGTRFGLLCYDEWDDKYAPVMAVRMITKVVDGVEIEMEEEYETEERTLVCKAGNRWGIRTDQCLWLESAYLRRRIEKIESRLAMLESS